MCGISASAGFSLTPSNSARANGGNATKVLASENDPYKALAWSPTGLRLAYTKPSATGVGGSVETVSLTGGPPSEVFSDPKLEAVKAPDLLWLRDGRIVFEINESVPATAQSLWEIMADPETGKPTGTAAKITNWGGSSAGSPTFSRDGTRLVVVKNHPRDDVYVGELHENGAHLDSPKRFTVSESTDFASGWTHDSKAVLFVSNRTGRFQIFRQSLDLDTAEVLAPGPDDEGNARVSPDGAWILYASTALGSGDSQPTTGRLMRLPMSGGPPEKILEASATTAGFDCPYRSSSSCVFSNWENGQLIFYKLDPTQGQGKELARTKLGQPAAVDWKVSPEGSRVAVFGGDQPSGHVHIIELETGGERNLQLPHGWSIWNLSWAADGKALFVAAQSKTTGYLIVHIGLDGKSIVLLDRGRNQWLGFPCPSPDGRRLAFSQQTFETNAYLLENF